MTNRILNALASLALRHSKLIAIISLFVAALAIAGASLLRFDPDILGFTPRNHKQVNDFHVVALQFPAGTDLRTYEPLVESIADGYRKSARIENVTHRAVSQDRSMLLIVAKPKRAARDVPFGRELLAEGAIIEARGLKEFQKVRPDAPLPLIEHTGGYQIAARDEQLIRGDILINVLVSFFGVLALFVFGFRRVASIFYAAAPMALALALTFGLAGVVYGELSTAGAGCAALLAGLGINFITVLYGRYVDERNRGETTAHALLVAMRQSIPGIFLAAIAIAATFYALLATDFRGMKQLGFLTGTGILFFLVAAVLLLPALIVLGERSEKRRASKVYLHSFGSGMLIKEALARPKATVIIWAVFTLLACAAATRIRFSDDLRDLRPQGNEGVVTQEKVTEKFGQTPDFMMVEKKELDDVRGTLRRSVRADASRATAIGFAAVLLLLIASFRSVKMTMLAFVPFLAGTAGMLGLMALFGRELDFMNVFVALMILGCATSYAVSMLRRFLEDPDRFPQAARETGKVVVMATLTAMVGYGSFALSHYPALRSIGYASAIGIGICGVAAITLLPAILVQTRRRD